MQYLDTCIKFGDIEIVNNQDITVYFIYLNKK